MNLSPQTQAVLLLTAHFSEPRANDARPLTPTEWGKFALWLRDEKLAPEALLAGYLRDKLARWTDPQITQDRIDRLLGRGSALAIAVEKWLRSGLWVLTRSDAAYPSRLKQRLSFMAPAVLFGCGNVALLERRTVAVVGSRDASADDLDYSRCVGEGVADAGAAVVSGGARGVDEAAMLGALEAEGTSVGVLADSLLRASSSLKYRKHLLSDNLVLLSPFYPEAGFNAGNAMGRNKYIYCLIRRCNCRSRWNQRRYMDWCIRKPQPGVGSNLGQRDNGCHRGQRADRETWRVLAFGGHSESRCGGAPPSAAAADSSQPSLDIARDERTADREGANYEVAPTSIDGVEKTHQNAGNEEEHEPGGVGSSSVNMSFYELFLRQVKEACGATPRTAAELEKLLELTKPQLKLWLERAVTEAKLKKTKRPVKYEWAGEKRQRSIF